MRSRLTKLGAALAALAALAVGGSALASASGGGSSPATAPPFADSTAEPAESGSEALGDDGPGGYADEPGNPNADTQQEGEH